MAKRYRRYKGENFDMINPAEKLEEKSSSSTVSKPPTRAEQAMSVGNRKLRELEEERETCERELSRLEEIEDRHEMENQQDINRYEELRELWKNDSRQYATHSEMQMRLVELQTQRRKDREVRAEEVKKMRESWLKQEDEIYKTMRKETENWGTE
jgi:uncharacterized membrane protein YccC